MPDIVSERVRSQMMRAIRSADTGPELRVRRFLHRAGLRFRLHDKRLPGTPDIVLPAFGTVVFVHGCFWHRHKGCRYATTPATHRQFWLTKFEQNSRRDRDVRRKLKRAGWRVDVIWECQTTRPVELEKLLWKILS